MDGVSASTVEAERAWRNERQGLYTNPWTIQKTRDPLITGSSVPQSMEGIIGNIKDNQPPLPTQEQHQVQVSQRQIWARQQQGNYGRRRDCTSIRSKQARCFRSDDKTSSETNHFGGLLTDQ